jgi:predicted metal-dependent hydrolase
LGSTLPYKGNKYQIRIIKSKNFGNENIQFKNNQFVISLNKKKSGHFNYSNRIELLYKNWLFYQSKNVFEEKIRRFSKTINVNPKKLITKNLKNRWGSATNKGIINLNYNLIKAPDEVIDYIIIHELCHFLIKDHSHRYWNLLKAYMTDYQTKIDWLNINGKSLLQ